MIGRRLSRSLRELGRPLPIGAVILLLLNDRVLKGAFHNAVTGKLSDVATCLLLPLLISAVLGIFSDARPASRLLVGAAVSVAVFTALEMSELADAIFGRVMSAIGFGPVLLTRDVTDLATLLCAPLAVLYGLRAAPMSWAGLRTVLGALTLVTGSLGLMATSSPGCSGGFERAIIYQAEPGCGPGGLFSVEAGEARGTVAIQNGRAVGLPDTLGTPRMDGESDYSCSAVDPSRGWQATALRCAPSNAGASDAGASTDASGCEAQTCVAQRDSNGLWFRCSGGGAVPACQSRLTVVP